MIQRFAVEQFLKDLFDHLDVYIGGSLDYSHEGLDDNLEANAEFTPSAIQFVQDWLDERLKENIAAPTKTP